MVHQCQCLALGFKAGDDLFGVHAQLDDFERDAAAHRLLLLGHVNHATAALADLLKEFVVTDLVARLFGEGDGKGTGGLGGVRRKAAQGWRVLVGVQHGRDVLTQPGVGTTSLVEVRSAFRRGEVQRRVNDGFELVGGCAHKPGHRSVSSRLHARMFKE